MLEAGILYPRAPNVLVQQAVCCCRLESSNLRPLCLLLTSVALVMMPTGIDFPFCDVANGVYHLQLAVRAHNVTVKEHEGLNEEDLKKCKLGGDPFDDSRLWHMDMADTPTPCEVSAMYMVHPAPGGIDDTIFARYRVLSLSQHIMTCSHGQDMITSYEQPVAHGHG